MAVFHRRQYLGHRKRTTSVPHCLNHAAQGRISPRTIDVVAKELHAVRYRATVGSLRSTLLAELPLHNQKFITFDWIAEMCVSRA